MTVKSTIDLSPRDIEVLRALQDNDGRGRKQIAHDLGMSESALSKAVSRFEAAGIVRKSFKVILDPKKLGFQSVAIIRVECKDLRELPAVAQTIALWPEVQEVHEFISDMKTLFLKVRARNMSDLVTCQEKLRDIHEVKTFRTDIVKTLKEETDIAL